MSNCTEGNEKGSNGMFDVHLFLTLRRLPNTGAYLYLEIAAQKWSSRDLNQVILH